MWVLFVISYIAEYDDYKITEFARYETQNFCNATQAVLESNFSENEATTCVFLK